jgi:hypothetical protein
MKDELERVREVALDEALHDGDLSSALPALLRVTRERAVLDAAVAHCNRELQLEPDDAVLRRARAMIVGAMHTTAYGSSLVSG